MVTFVVVTLKTMTEVIRIKTRWHHDCNAMQFCLNLPDSTSYCRIWQIVESGNQSTCTFLKTNC